MYNNKYVNVRTIVLNSIILVLGCAISVSCTAIETDTTGQAPNTSSQIEAMVYNWFTNSQLENGLIPSTDEGTVVSLYDNALAVIVFLIHEDFDRAEKVLDYFNSHIQSELKNYKGIPTADAPGGFAQFRDTSGKILDDIRWMGDNCWLLIAVRNYHQMADNSKYSEMEAGLINWISALQNSDGSLKGGFQPNEEGMMTEIHPITEGMIDAFNALPGYTDIHIGLLEFLESKRWDASKGLLVAWPNPPNPDWKFALDTIPWGYLGLQDFPQSTLAQAETLFLNEQQAKAKDIVISGFCADMERNHVWLEGNGQMMTAYIQANMTEKAEYYRKEMEKLFLESPIHDNAGGFPYVANIDNTTSFGGADFWDGADTAIALSSGAWYLFSAKGFNPMEVGYSKEIPEDDLFWRDAGSMDRYLQ